MKLPPVPLLWTEPDWLAQAQAWIFQKLEDANAALTGPMDQMHVRLWSTVIRVPTDAGTFYFKACEPATEARLTIFLGQIQPENIPHLIAADPERGWMLMRDAGPMLRTFLKIPADLAILEPALARFAGLQLAVLEQSETLLSLGAMDRRLERLPGLFEQLLAQPDLLRLEAENGLSSAQYQQLRAALPRYTQMCRQLQAYQVPETLHHDDFHDGNIFVSGLPGAYRYVFSDWGESALAHPFFSMMLCLRSVGWRAGFPDESTDAPDRMPPALNHLRDVYLSPWERFETPETLVKIFDLSWRVGMVSRAVTWSEFVSSLDPDLRADYHHIVPAWLGEFLIALK
jgi:hypothetical protein